jgi:hypothetical protein
MSWKHVSLATCHCSYVFFISTANGEPWDTCQQRSPLPRRGAVRSRRTRVSVGALLGGEVGSGAKGCVAALEPSQMVRWNLESQDMWQCRSPPRWWGGIRSLNTCGSAGTLIDRGVGPGALRYVAILEPSLSSEAGSETTVTRGSTWMHALPSVLVWSIYTGYSVCRVSTLFSYSFDALLFNE